VARECIRNGWAFLQPDFHGPNNRPQALGSDLVMADIENVAASAWVPITDLPAWHTQCLKNGQANYARDIEAACGGVPSPGTSAEKESPSPVSVCSFVSSRVHPDRHPRRHS
jgi:hypothetical protein